MSTEQTTVEIVSWSNTKAILRGIREAVFILEQHVPQELEWDDYDSQCTHVLALTDNNKPIGTGRILADGHIGRVAVLAPFRGKGVGSKILFALINFAKNQGMQRVFLHSQSSAVPFYKRHGFVVVSDEFMDAGIPHRTMERIL